MKEQKIIEIRLVRGKWESEEKYKMALKESNDPYCQDGEFSFYYFNNALYYNRYTTCTYTKTKKVEFINPGFSFCPQNFPITWVCLCI